MVVFENRFPSFAGAATAPGSCPNPLLAHAPASGRCEVVCFTSDHDARFSSLSAARAHTVVDVWADRTAELSAMDAVEDVFCSENRGEEIGVTLGHPHGQIYAYPFVPPRTLRMIAAAKRHGGCLHCAALTAEKDAGLRVVARVIALAGLRTARRPLAL